MDKWITSLKLHKNGIILHKKLNFDRILRTDANNKDGEFNRDMYVVKKKILIITGIFMIIVLSLVTAFSISYGSGKLSPKREINVVIDAGHGGVDGGAPGYSKKILESDLNLAIALKLKGYFEAAEIGVTLTRADKNGLYGTPDAGFKRRDMLERKRIIDGSDADLVISIHMNTFPTATRTGAQAFFRKGSELGISAATSIQLRLNQYINTSRAYEALKGDYYILNCSDIPSVIVECGFISNPQEEQLLATEDYQDKLAYNIFAGAVYYLSGSQAAFLFER